MSTPRVYRAYLGEIPVFSAHNRAASCFFTGHRDFTADKDSEKLIKEAVDSLINRGVTHFYAGGARGFDTFAEITILNRRLTDDRIKLTLALPFEGYTHKSDKILSAQFNVITDICDEIVYLSPKFSIDSYQKRNVFMANRSAYCICWQISTDGGTANAVNYARKAGLRLIPLASPEQTTLPI